MVVTHLNVYDSRGGAARAANRLHKGLLKQGVSSKIFAQHRFEDDQTVIEYRQPTDRFDRWLASLWQQWIALAARRHKKFRKPGLELFTDARPLFAARPLRQLPLSDILHLHWIARFIDIGDLARRTTAPIVWTLHDMNAFTGGCHYGGGCDRYLSGCGRCPQLGSQVENDLSRRNYLHKQKAFSAIAPERLQIVTPSRWLAKLAGASPLLKKFRISVIPYGLDLDSFAPGDKLASRRALQIPETARVVMFVADSLTNNRKGFALLTQALRRFEKDDNYRLIAVGRQDEARLAADNVLCLGSVDSDERLVSLFSAADVFVIPSLEDNLPNTVLEAMACGVPVVGFAAGGIPEMVSENRCGLLVPVGDVDALWHAVEALCTDDCLREEFSCNARAAAIGNYALELQARRYLDIYREMLS